jgi:hypothetical protein
MPPSDNASSSGAIDRKLKALTAIVLDPAATEAEKANAHRLKARLEARLSRETAPEAGWTDVMFRLGRGVKAIKSLPSPKGDWTDHAFRLGRMLRRAVKK